MLEGFRGDLVWFGLVWLMGGFTVGGLEVEVVMGAVEALVGDQSTDPRMAFDVTEHAPRAAEVDQFGLELPHGGLPFGFSRSVV